MYVSHFQNWNTFSPVHPSTIPPPKKHSLLSISLPACINQQAWNCLWKINKRAISEHKKRLLKNKGHHWVWSSRGWGFFVKTIHFGGILRYKLHTSSLGHKDSRQQTTTFFIGQELKQQTRQARWLISKEVYYFNLVPVKYLQEVGICRGQSRSGGFIFSLLQQGCLKKKGIWRSWPPKRILMEFFF